MNLPIYKKILKNNQNLSSYLNNNNLPGKFYATTAALQIRAGHRSINVNLWPLTVHIYHVMIIVIGGFSKKSFLLLFSRNSFE